MRNRFIAGAVALGTAAVLAAPAPTRAQGPHAPSPQAAGARRVVVDGDMWMQSRPDERKAFLVGVGNMLALETAYAQKHNTPPAEPGAMAARALEHVSLDQMSDRITRWYAANPTRRSVPVVGVIWMDMVRPASAGR